MWLNLFNRYLKGAKVGDNILVKATTEKVGKNLAFLNVQVVNKESGSVLAQGIQNLSYTIQCPLFGMKTAINFWTDDWQFFMLQAHTQSISHKYKGKLSFYFDP